MTSRVLPALTLALAATLALSACDSQSSEGRGTTGTPGGTMTSSESPTPGVTTGDSTWKPGEGPQTPPPGDDRPVAAGPERLYAYEPNGHSQNAWSTNGAKAGIITSAEQIPGVVTSLPATEQPAATQKLAAAAKVGAPSAQQPWYVFASDGCQVTLELTMEDGNPKPTIKDPAGGPAQCFAPEWRVAVYRYDASAQTTTPPTFTAPKA